MFDAILRSKFYSKCKSEIKMTRRRIEIIKRKRNAMLKFLRNDVADLLKKGLDSNAYGRVEQLYVDQNVSSCYEFVEQSCLLILNHLSAMDKPRECPEECKEAISTLMFAAARFADLPELRELRSLFTERYGNFLEPYANKEFVKNLKADTPTEDIKLLMLLDIKLEYDIEWDSKALEQKLYKPPPFVQDSSHYANERNNQLPKPHHQNGLETHVQETEIKHSNKPTEAAKKDHTLENGFPYKSRPAEVETKKERHNNNQTTGNSLPYKSRAEVEKKQEVKHGQGRGSPYWSSTSSSSSSSSSDSATSQDDSSSASEDGLEGRKLYASLRSNPPPYVKPDTTRKDDNYIQSASKGTLMSVGPPYVKTEVTNSEASSNITPKSVPRSVRIRRPLKPVSGSHGHNEISRQTPKASNVDHDYDHGNEEENRRERIPYKLPCDSKEVPAPTRITSLPAESLVTPADSEESKKGLARAVTYQADTDLSRGQGQGHVHPKLPDYDDFVARLAAFRAGS